MRADIRPDTAIVHAGRHPDAQHGAVNPPVYHVSTVTFPTVAALEAASSHPWEGMYYGRMGTPTTFALEEAVAELEGGFKAVSTSSGLAAITSSLLAFLKSGDHLLMPDSVYNPARRFCDGMLRHLGVETTYYDPLIGAAIKELIRPNTRVVYLESPGSLTFEVQDIPAIAQAAKAAGAVTLLDNTWATPLFFKPFEHGVDVSIHAATKYIVGHSDAMLGIVTCTEATYKAVKATVLALGNCPGPDSAYLGLRGLRSMKVRLERHQETGIRLAHWLKDRPEVARVLHPALPQDPNHALWRRDFKGACGLFGVVLRPFPHEAVAAMLDGLALFAMGYSWGGYESLILPTNPATSRTATTWRAEGPCLRLHAGLEDPEDLIADLEKGLERLRAA